MKKYMVEKVVSYTYHIIVEAENAEEAQEIAEKASDTEWKEDAIDNLWGCNPYGTTVIKQPKLIKED